MSFGATDQQRSLFLKGFKLSKQGNYEDPTYLGFKIVFDFGNLPVGPDDGLPPSPLFRDRSYFYGAGASNFAENPFGQPQYDSVSGSADGKVAFYSATSYLEERESDFAYGGKRSDMLRQFKLTLNDIVTNSPWFIQSIGGLDKLAQVGRPGYSPQSDGGEFNPQRTGGKVLEISTLESINLRMSALADLYNQATFDYDNMRELLPRNLRKFRMYIFVSEVRNFFKTSRLIGSSAALTAIDNLSTLLGSGNNPGSNLGASTGVDSQQNENFKAPNANISPSSSFNSFVGNVVNQSGLDNDLSLLKNQQDQSGIKPVMVFECRGCEFDFTESTPISDDLNIGTSAEAVTQKFKIHIDRVRVRSQYPNIRQDGKPLVLGDSWDGARSSVQKNPKDQDDILSIGSQLLTNFVSNSLNDLINEGVANFIQPNLQGLNKLALGNAYSFNPGEILTSLSFNNAQKFLDGLGGVNAGISKTDFPTPQSTGLGGPPQRAYPAPGGDVYSRVAGADLGVPERVYPEPSGDVYTGVPGADLGAPDRVYPAPQGDVYSGVPGSDLGVPGRVYPAPQGDVYSDVPGADLGVPDRVYPAPQGDVYDNVPGSDLGSPDRVYPAPGGDVYANVPGSDLGVPDRIYPEFNDSVYPEPVPGQNLGNTERVYNDVEQSASLGESQVYTDVIPPPSNAELNQSIYPAETQITSNGELRSPSNTFNSTPTPVYPKQEVKYRRGDIGKVYPSVSGDFDTSDENLGNLKPDTKYNISIDGFNPKSSDFN